ncbi:MAG: Cof-type HAD-IIB family hydrolase [Oribacterium sp.]|nr:Cof-type HAD-IIB family hydrolase [Oribacterium sp.]
MTEDCNYHKTYQGLVAFDLDHTLLDHKTWQITPSALDAIRKLKEKHYLTVIASGRNMHAPYSVEYLNQVKPDALVHMNGTRVEYGTEVLQDHRMDVGLLKRVLEFCEGHGLAVGMQIDEVDYFTWPDQVVKHDMDYWGSSERNFDAPEKLLELPVRALAYCGDKAGADELAGAFPELSVLMFSKDTGADVFEKGFSKADGLHLLAEKLGIDWQRTYAFGDSHNDRSMLEAVSCGIAMGNAVPEIKEIADYVTDAIDQDGIYHALIHFGLIS